MNKRPTTKPSLLKGGSIALVAMMATILAPIAPEAALADAAGNFGCRASAVRVELNSFVQPRPVPYIEPAIANGAPTDHPGNPNRCADDSEAVAENSITDAGITVTTKGAFARTDVVEGREATAEAGVTEYTVERPTDLGGILRVQVAHSRASAICNGATATLSGSSKVSSVTLDGVELLPEPVGEYLEIDTYHLRGVAEEAIFLNQKKESSGLLRQTAVTVTGQAYTITMGVAAIGAGTGGMSPCGADSPVVSVGDASAVAEGTPGVPGHAQGMARFPVSLSRPSATDVTVNYNTANGSAIGTASGAGGDYKAMAGTVTIAAGQTSKMVEVPVTMDSSSTEPDENFFLDLVSSSVTAGVVVADTRGEAIIIDDDPASASTLSVSDATVTEPVAGTTTPAVFTVSLWPPSAGPVSVRAVTAEYTAHPLPHESNDYVHVNQILNFAPHETTKQVAVTINGDNVDERDETFTLALEDSVGAQREKRQGLGVIANDDGLPTVSIDDATAMEGFVTSDGGPIPRAPVRFTVSLSAASFRPISVDYASLDGTARSTNSGVVGPADYKPVSGRLNFAPGETTKTVEVELIPDNIREPDEYFFVQLSGAVNATQTKRVGRGTITTDDDPRG